MTIKQLEKQRKELQARYDQINAERNKRDTHELHVEALSVGNELSNVEKQIKFARMPKKQRRFAVAMDKARNQDFEWELRHTHFIDNGGANTLSTMIDNMPANQLGQVK